MATITNTAAIIDYSGNPPTVTYSNPVTTEVQDPRPNVAAAAVAIIAVAAADVRAAVIAAVNAVAVAAATVVAVAVAAAVAVAVNLSHILKKRKPIRKVGFFNRKSPDRTFQCVQSGSCFVSVKSPVLQYQPLKYPIFEFFSAPNVKLQIDATSE